jgi:DNA-binding MarR family transcriptional regulator
MSRIEPLGVSTMQFWLLVGIAEHPCHSQAELAAKLRIDEATASRTIRGLLGKGWVRAVRGAGDRRRVRLELTDGGEQLVRELLPIAREVRTAVDVALTPDERAATRAALVKIVTALKRLTEAAPAAAPGGPRRAPPRRAGDRRARQSSLA